MNKIILEAGINTLTGLKLQNEFAAISIGIDEDNINVVFREIELDKENNPYKPYTADVISITNTQVNASGVNRTISDEDLENNKAILVDIKESVLDLIANKLLNLKIPNRTNIEQS